VVKLLCDLVLALLYLLELLVLADPESGLPAQGLLLADLLDLGVRLLGLRVVLAVLAPLAVLVQLLDVFAQHPLELALLQLLQQEQELVEGHRVHAVQAQPAQGNQSLLGGGCLPHLF
jgi:hypothetical protein